MQPQNNRSPPARPPSVNQVLETEECLALSALYGRKRVTRELRRLLESMRRALANGSSFSMQQLLGSLGDRLQSGSTRQLTAVFNLTGILLHSNLGRARLAEEAIEALREAAGACNLEYDLDLGGRGERDSHAEQLICDLTGAEAALLVNNNAAAVLLCLNSLALHREVPVSRGELVEIGGSFRIPDIMRRAGCTLVEVGATNRTHLADYAAAAGRNTAAVMQVHSSNYRIQGFTHAVGTEELSRLCRQHDLPLIHDLGSGTLLDLQQFGLAREPQVAEVLEAGADLVTFSGDKLLGGPQAGVIAGKKSLVEVLRGNPLKRALRIDKLSLAALLATLRLYQRPDHLRERLPTLRLLSRSRNQIRKTAARIKVQLEKQLSGFQVQVTDCESQIGSGALPVDQLPSAAVSISMPDASQKPLIALARQLRSLPRPVTGRLHRGRLLLDMRCLEESEEADFLAQLLQLEVSSEGSPE